MRPISSIGTPEGSGVGRAALVATLKDGVSEEVGRHLRAHPPFGGWDAAERTAAFLTDREVIFVFQGRHLAGHRIRELENLSLWTDSELWREWIIDHPRAAAPVYWSERTDDLEGLFFGPTPGPGDSEGGELLLFPE